MALTLWRRQQNTKSNGSDMPRKGSGADCQMCPENSFTANYDSKECERCPQGSKAPAGSISHSSCICDVGVLYKSNGTWTLCSTWHSVHCNMFPHLFSALAMLSFCLVSKSKVGITFPHFLQDHSSGERRPHIPRCWMLLEFRIVLISSGSPQLRCLEMCGMDLFLDVS